MPLIQGGPPEWIWGKNSRSTQVGIGSFSRLEWRYSLRSESELRPRDHEIAVLYDTRSSDFSR